MNKIAEFHNKFMRARKIKHRARYHRLYKVLDNSKYMQYVRREVFKELKIFR